MIVLTETDTTKYFDLFLQSYFRQIFDNSQSAFSFVPDPLIVNDNVRVLLVPDIQTISVVDEYSVPSISLLHIKHFPAKNFQFFQSDHLPLRMIVTFPISSKICSLKRIFLRRIFSFFFKDFLVPNTFSSKVSPIRALSKIHNEHPLVLARSITLGTTKIMV